MITALVLLVSGCVTEDTGPVGLAVSRGDLSLCGEDFDFSDYTQVASEPESCTIKALEEFNDIYSCKLLPQIQKRLCIHHLAVRNNDPEVCNSFQNGEHRSDCRGYVGK